MLVLVNARRQLIAWSDDDGVGLPPTPPDGMVVQVAAFAAPPPAPYVWSPEQLTFVVPTEPPPPRRPLSPLTFQWRFNIIEQRALKNIERTHANTDVRNDLAIMRESLANITDPLGVNVQDPRTVFGATLMVDVLIEAGIIAAQDRAARLAQVLAP